MIYFRQVDEPRIGKGIFWHVEFYSAEGSAFPVGTAYVESPPAGLPTLRFILVADQWRSKGIATRLMAACVEKWPHIEFTAPISKTGERAVNRAVRDQSRPLPEMEGLV
jgi:GNAT superfamily N-acetyltransferase